MKIMYNRLPVYIAGTAAVVAATSCSEEKKEKEQQYNIVYIMTDDHTSQMMSCYDNRFVETPNLDSIAADGVLLPIHSVDRAVHVCLQESIVMLTDFMIIQHVFSTVHSRRCQNCFKKRAIKLQS